MDKNLDFELIGIGEGPSDSLEARLLTTPVLINEVEVARILFEEKAYSLAVAYYTDALKIQRFLSLRDIDILSECHKNIAETYRIHESLKAFSHYKRSQYLLSSILNAIKKYELGSEKASKYKEKFISTYIKWSTLFMEDGWVELHNPREAKLRRYENGLEFFCAAYNSYKTLGKPSDILYNEIGEAATLWANTIMRNKNLKIKKQLSKDIFEVAEEYCNSAKTEYFIEEYVN